MYLVLFVWFCFFAMSNMGMENIPVNLAIGADHMLLINNNKQVLSYGSGTNGQLGHNNYNGIVGTQKAPKIIEFFAGMVPISVAAGDDFSLVLLDNGALYAFGKNAKLDGHAIVISNQPSPTLIETLKNQIIVQVDAGERFTAALDAAGKLYLLMGGSCQEINSLHTLLKRSKLVSMLF
jgi:alpha-tubulin suppressor-like RCC1 family protein